MQSISRKFTNPGQIMFDTFVGVRATTKPYLLDNRHQKFASCDMDSDSIQQTKPLLSKVLGDHVLNPEPNIERDGSVGQTAGDYLSRWHVSMDQKRKGLWKLNYCLRPLQTFPAHFTNFSTYFYDGRLFENDRNLPCSQRSELL